MAASEQLPGEQFSPPPALFPPRGYIVGAPKCGTTALAHYLSEHPQIAFSRPKEPHYFAPDLPGLRRTSEEEKYRSFFSVRPDTRVTLEGSVWYLYSETAIEEILRHRPDARFIVMLRHPVEMLASLHRQLLNALDEDEPDFATAWRLSADRAAGRRIPRTCRAPSTLVYTRTAAFGRMLERLFSLAEAGNILVLFQEDMHADAGRTYDRVLHFLGLENDRRQVFGRVNEAAGVRSRRVKYLVARGRPVREVISKPVKRMLGVPSLGVLKRMKSANTAPVPRASVPPAVREEIGHHYADDMRRLGALLGIDLAARYGWPDLPSTLPRSRAPTAPRKGPGR